MDSLRTLAFFVITSLVVVVCCQGSEQKDYGDELHMGIDVPDFNPHFNVYFNASSSEALITDDIIYSTLFELRKDEKLVPLLVKSWETDESRKEWILHLRDDVRFHDGSPFEAEDVIYSFRYVMNHRESYFHSLLTSVNSFELIDKDTLKIRLNKNDLFFTYALMKIFQVKRGSLDKPDEIKLNGTGPFQFDSFKDSVLVLKVNDRYFRGRPRLDKVYFHFLPNQMTAMAKLLLREVDFIYLPDPTYEQLFEEDRRFKVLTQRGPMYYDLEFDFKNPKYADKNVRLALNYALPKAKIAEDVLPGSSVGGIVSSFLGNDADGNLTFDFDADKALSYFRKAGWSLINGKLIDGHGRPFHLTLHSIVEAELNTRIAYNLMRYLQNIGIEVSVHSISLSALGGDFFNSSYDTLLSLFNMKLRPIYSYNYWHSTDASVKGSTTVYKDESVDSDLDRMRFARNKQERNEAYRDFEKNLAVNPPAVFLFWRQLPLVIDKRFHGLSEHPEEFTLEIKNLWVPKEEQKYK